MASLMDRLKALGIGKVTPEYRARQADKRLAESFRIPYKPNKIEERTLNFQMRPKSMSNVNVPVGGVMTGMPGVQGMTDLGLFGSAPTPPTARPVAPPPRRDIVPPSPANREIPRDVLPFVESPTFPDRLPSSTEIPTPVVPEARMPERREVPIPGAGLFEPPAMDPIVEKPNLDTAVENLMARYDALYSGKPPVAPQPRMPEPRDLGLPAFTTPGYVPEGLMTPQRPPTPAVQPYLADMFTGRLPMPEPTSQLFVDEMGNLVDAAGNIVQSAAERMVVPDWETMDIPYTADAFADESNF